MAKFSTGLRNGMLYNTPFATALGGGRINIYAGAVPATADAAVTGTLLAVITDDGGSDGLYFSTPSDAVISKVPEQIWKTNAILSSGVASYFRLVRADDDGTESNTAHRVQGTVAQAGADMNVSNISFTSGQPWVLSSFNLALPTR